MKKILFSFLILCALSFAITEKSVLAIMLPEENETTVNDHVPQNSKAKIIKKCLSKGLIIAGLFAILLSTANDDQKDYMLKQLKPLNLTKNFIETFFTNILITLGHELGHALAAKIVNGDKFDIHIGAKEARLKPLAKLHGISIDGIDPTSGFSHVSNSYSNAEKITLTIIKNYCKNHHLDPNHLTQNNINEMLESPEADEAKEKLKTDKLSTFVILASGTIFGLLTNYLIRFFKIYANNSMPLNFQKIKSTSLQALWPDEHFVSQLSNLVLPSNDNDCAKILKTCFKASNATIQEINDLSFLATLAATAGVKSLNKPADSPGTWNTEITTGLINYLLLGYLKFKS